ncbi:hypothetical protein NS263_10110 [Curtobacterium oceanosedimentum]|uniref:Uncharacterized protein n=1 Tax=Curtobacterium oceanosedimentum TaxID=465820 RepID=A0ABR5S8A5_9MICO|nr:hypothetical protein NS263_10110 [Curtobacterium oceanosedimentum]
MHGGRGGHRALGGRPTADGAGALALTRGRRLSAPDRAAGRGRRAVRRRRGSRAVRRWRCRTTRPLSDDVDTVVRTRIDPNPAHDVVGPLIVSVRMLRT